MDDLMTNKRFSVTHAFGIFLFIYCLCFHNAQAVYPMERDVVELTGISPSKRWIVFMAKKVKVCLDDAQTEEYSNVISYHGCMARIHSRSCVHRNRLQQCTLIHEYPNILTYVSDRWDKFSIKIVVHRNFDLNLTVSRFAITPFTFQKTEITHFKIAGNGYVGIQHPVTVMSSNSTIEVEFNVVCEYCLVIEYGVGQGFNKMDHRPLRVNAMYFPWNDFLVSYFNILVDMRAILALDISSCLQCRFIVYDGPTARLPIIMSIDGTERSKRVVASTFQVFVVAINDVHQQETLIIHAPIYRNTAVFNLSKSEYHEINFDNHSNCHGHSFSARLCVYTFFADAAKTLQFSLTDLQFEGPYQGAKFAAGLVLFDHTNETVEKILELNNDLPSLSVRDLEVVGTGSQMHVAVFVYSVFASLTLNFSISATKCNTLIISNKYVSYSGLITPLGGTQRFSAYYINQTSSALLEFSECFRFQFIRSPLDIFIILPHNTPSRVSKYDVLLLPKPYHGCVLVPIAQSYIQYARESQTYMNMYTESFIQTISGFRVMACNVFTYSQIRIEQLPCKIRCQYLDQYLDNTKDYSLGHVSQILGQDIDENKCDICENSYIYPSYGIPVAMRDNISFPFLVKSATCTTIYMYIKPIGKYATPFLDFRLNRTNMISRIPDFTGETMIQIYKSVACFIEIPISHIAPLFRVPRQKRPWYKLEAVYRGGVLYRQFFRINRLGTDPVSWNFAARSCLKAGQSLLTIHSMAEFDFVKETFLTNQDTSLVYVGLMRKVIYLNNSLIWTNNNLNIHQRFKMNRCKF